MQPAQVITRRWKLKQYSYAAAIFACIIAVVQLFSSTEAQVTIETLESNHGQIIGSNPGFAGQEIIIDGNISLETDSPDNTTLNQPTYQSNKTEGDKSPIVQNVEGGVEMNFND